MSMKKTILLLFPLLLFLLNFFLKFAFVTYEEIGLDEPFTIYHAQFDFGTIIEQLKKYNNPPLYELIVHVWIKLFGISPLSVRMLPLIFASLGPVALYFFGKRFFSTEIALASSLLLSFSDLLFYYSHDCRVYSLFLLLSILSMHFFLRIVNEKPKTSSVILFVLFSSLLIYGHYFGVFVLFFQGAYLLFFHRDKILKFLLYYAVILLLFLPHIYAMLTRMTDSVKHGTWIESPKGLESLYNMLWVFCNFPLVTVVSIAILVFALAKLAIKKDYLHPKPNVVLMVLWFLLPYFGLFFISYKIPMYISRYLIFVLPAFYILLAVCIHYLINNNILRYTLLAALILGFGLTIDFGNDKKEKTTEAVNIIRSKKDPATLVIICGHDYMPGFAYYYKQNYFSAITDNQEYTQMENLLGAENIYAEYAIPDTLDRARYAKVIYYGIGGYFNSVQNPTLSYLNTQYHLVETKPVKMSGQIYFFEK